MRGEFLNEVTDSDEAVETYNVEYSGHLRVFKKVNGFEVWKGIEAMLDSDL